MNIVEKPWGSYIDYFRDADCVFKIMTIKPGQSMSYQVHKERNEVWVVSNGTASIKTSVYGDDSALTNYMMSELEEGEFILIQNESAHQIANNGDDDLIIYEMQFGNCSEEDIIRLHDPHNRQ